MGESHSMNATTTSQTNHIAAEYRRVLGPQGAVEEEICDRIVQLAASLRSADSAARRCFLPREQERLFRLANGFERGYYRAVAELKRLQAQRTRTTADPPESSQSSAADSFGTAPEPPELPSASWRPRS